MTGIAHTKSDRATWLAAAVFGTALLLRLAAAVWFPLEPTADAAHYEALGRGLSQGQGFNGAFRPPLYPAFIATVYWLAGSRLETVRIAQVIVDLGTCALLFWWAKRRLGSEPALLTLLVAGISLSAIGSVRVLMSECLASFFLAFVVIGFDLSLPDRDRIKISWLACVGLSAGLLTLTRGIMILFPFILLLCLLFEGISWRKKLGGGAVLLLCYVVVLAPWCVRNWTRLGSPVLTTQVGIAFYSSHVLNPGQPYGVLTTDSVTEQAAKLSPVAGSRFLTYETLRRLRENPWIAVKAYPWKLLSFWVPLDWEIIGGRTWNLPYIFILVFGIVGAKQLWKSKPRFVIHALLPLAYLCFMAFLFYGSPRFRLPAEPLLVPLTAAGIVAMRKWAKELAFKEGSGH